MAEENKIGEEAGDVRLINAEKWKQEGNEYFKKGKDGYQDALRLYKRAIDVQCSDDRLNASLHGNLAAVYFSLNKHTDCIDSCRRSLTLDPNNVKVWSRAARSSFALELYAQTIELATKGLMIQSTNEELLDLKQRSEAKLSYLRQQREKNSKSEEENVPLINFDGEEATELQTELNVLNRQIATAEGELQSCKKSIVRCDLVKREMEIILGERKEAREEPLLCFMQHGKAFFKASSEKVMESVAEESAEAQKILPRHNQMVNGLMEKRAEKELRLKGMVRDMQERQARGEKLEYAPRVE